MKEVPRPKYLFRHYCQDYDWDIVHEHSPEFLFCHCQLPEEDGYGSIYQRVIFKEVIRARLETECAAQSIGDRNADNSNQPDPDPGPATPGHSPSTHPAVEGLYRFEGAPPSDSPILDKLSSRG